MFAFSLARELKMTVGELMERCSTDELAYWQAVAMIDADEAKQRELDRRAKRGAQEMQQQLRRR